MPPCLTLSIIRYGSKVKWSNQGKRVALSPAPWCSSYRKGSLQVTLNCGCQLYLYNIVALSTFSNVTVKDCSWKNEFIIAVQSYHMLYKIRVLTFHYTFKIMWITVSDFSIKYLCCYQSRTQPTINHSPC